MLRRLEGGAIPEGVLDVCRALEGAGHRAWVVGGCIRDLLMERRVSDWDLATSALPQDVQRVFRRTLPTGLSHGTVTVMWKGEAYEVTTLRGEGAYSDGRRPDSVEFVTDIDHDLARRDFTVNAIAYDPLLQRLVDPWGGVADLEERVLRAVGDPEARFGEDGLRVLRAARFCATLGFALDPATEAAIPGSLETFKRVSPERVHDEWKKALKTSAAPSPAFEIMRRTGILAVTCPPLAELAEPLFARTLRRVDEATPDPELRMAALLLDIEADALWRVREAWADAWLRSLRASNQERRRVLHLMRHGRLPDPGELDAPALRRWLRDVGREHVEDVIELGRADGAEVDTLRARAYAELTSGVPLATRELPIDGTDVMRALDVKPGRAIGVVLERLLDRVLEDPAEADPARLRAALAETYRAAITPSGEGAP